MFRGVWSVECGVRYAFKNKWFDICILYLSTIFIPHSTLHTPQDNSMLKITSPEYLPMSSSAAARRELRWPRGRAR